MLFFLHLLGSFIVWSPIFVLLSFLHLYVLILLNPDPVEIDVNPHVLLNVLIAMGHILELLNCLLEVLPVILGPYLHLSRIFTLVERRLHLIMRVRATDCIGWIGVDNSILHELLIHLIFLLLNLIHPYFVFAQDCVELALCQFGTLNMWMRWKLFCFSTLHRFNVDLASLILAHQIGEIDVVLSVFEGKRYLKVLKIASH